MSQTLRSKSTMADGSKLKVCPSTRSRAGWCLLTSSPAAASACAVVSEHAASLGIEVSHNHMPGADTKTARGNMILRQAGMAASDSCRHQAPDHCLLSQAPDAQMYARTTTLTVRAHVAPATAPSTWHHVQLLLQQPDKLAPS